MNCIDKFPTRNTSEDLHICFFDGDLPSFQEVVYMKLGARVGRVIADGLYMRGDALYLKVRGHADPKLDVELRSGLPGVVKDLEDGADYFMAGGGGKSRVDLPCVGEAH